MKAFCGGYLLGWAASFLVSLAGEAKLWLVRVALTQSCLGAKKDKGAREPRAVAKQWVVPVHRDVKRGGLMGRIQQPWSRCVLLQLPERDWRKGEKGRRGKCDQGWEGQDSVEMDNSCHCFGRFYLGGGPQFLKVVVFINSFGVQGIVLGA